MREVEKPRPSNRAAVRMCAVLIRAHREERIALSFSDVMRCQQGIRGSHIQWPSRVVLANLWSKHSGWDLAVEAGQTERIPDHVRAELSA